MELADMAYTKAETKEQKTEAKLGYPGERSRYPWGLQIRLEDEELKKLGVGELPAVGADIQMAIQVEVTGVNESRMADGKEERCVTLQITRMGIPPAPQEAAAPVQKPAPAKRTGTLLGNARAS